MEGEATEIYYGPRDSSFQALINNLLIKGKIKEKYVSAILNPKNMEMYSLAFTSKLVDPEYNLEYYEQVGDAVLYQFIVFYFYRRFPHLQKPEGVPVVARLKQLYGARKVLSIIADKEGFWPYISSTVENRGREKKRLLEDTFEAFLGVTALIIDTDIKQGVGYPICYDILSSVFDRIKISLKYEDLFDAKTKLKELFDAYKTLGNLKYVETKTEKMTTSTVYRVKKVTQIRDTKVQGNVTVKVIQETEDIIEKLGSGSAPLKDDAQQRAAEVAIKYLNNQGYKREIPAIYSVEYEDKFYIE